MTGREALTAARRMLERAGIPESEAKAKVIVAHVLGVGFADLYGCDVSHAAGDAIIRMARRCEAGEPAEYVTGEAFFRYLRLWVTPGVLIPRQETELVAQKAIDLIRENGYKTAIDVCTGSGCIAISLATETAARVDACDISEEALLLAKRNAGRNNAPVHFFISDMFACVSKTYDLIVCNPPYVSAQEYATLDRSVREHEPKIALLAGDGLDFYRIIAKKALQFLNGGGALVLEIGASQATRVMTLLVRNGFKDIECAKDYSGRDRILNAHKA